MAASPSAQDQTHASRSPELAESSDVLRHPEFRRLWVANAMRNAAAEVAGFALPVTALLLLHASALEVSVIFFCSRLGYLLIGLPAGVWVDRWQKKRILVISDLMYACSFGSIPIAYALGILTVPQMMAVAFLVSTSGVFFDVAHASILPQLLPKKRIADANARLQTSQTAIQAVSPSVAGVLTSTIAAPLLYCFTLLCHLGSALVVGKIKVVQEKPPTSGAPQRRFLREAAEGIKVLRDQPLLRLLFAQAALNNFGAGMMLSMMPVFLLKEIHLSPWMFGLLSTLGALAGFSASLVCPRLRRSLGEIRMTLVFSALTPAALIAAPLASVFRDVAVPLAAAAQICIGFVVVGRAVATAGLRARVTPTQYLGRVTAANNVVTQGATPLGSVVGGLIASATTTSVSLWVGVLEMCIPLIILINSPMRSLRTLPPEWEA
ncbi:MFS transporter [Kitasatospora sp. NPDC096128]|uniref:MFS transporter n=1 Tax=Kitasatospora sp. NPDC096128 TaxID=3155547 RepID=UPI00332F4B57